MKTGVCSCTMIVAVITVFYVVSAENLHNDVRYGKKDKFYDAGGRYGKRDSENVDRILLEDRIARRSSRGLWADRGSGDVQQVSPRAERFFMGSRYGKRNTAEAVLNGVVETDPEEQLSCRYTGMVNLYRCVSRDKYQETEGVMRESVNN